MMENFNSMIADEPKVRGESNMRLFRSYQILSNLIYQMGGTYASSASFDPDQTDSMFQISTTRVTSSLRDFLCTRDVFHLVVGQGVWVSFDAI